MILALGILIGVLLKSVWEVALLRLLLTERGSKIVRDVLKDKPRGEILSAKLPAAEQAAALLTKEYEGRPE